MIRFCSGPGGSWERYRHEHGLIWCDLAQPFLSSYLVVLSNDNKQYTNVAEHDQKEREAEIQHSCKERDYMVMLDTDNDGFKKCCTVNQRIF